MKTNRKSIRKRHQLASLATVSAIVVAPLCGSISKAQAQPAQQAPAWGYQAHNDDDHDHDQFGPQVSLTGRVADDLSGDQFILRANNGRTYRVVMHGNVNEPSNLDEGDRVRVTGHLDRDILIAHDVDILDNAGPSDPFGRQVTLTGIVANDLSGDQFLLRANNGRTYRVVFHRNVNEPSNLDEGDQVRVTGHLDRDILVAHDVDILSNQRWDRDDQFGRNVVLTGVVANDLDGDRFLLRTNSGRAYRVVFPSGVDEPRRLSRGDRVQVRGRWDSSRGVLVARNVRFLSDDDRNNPFGGLRTVNGTVIKDLSGDEFLMRADNGRTYRVVLRSGIDEPRRLSRGDRVQVQGRFDRNNRLIARDVNILRNNGNNYGTRRVSFSGRVQNSSGNTLHVLADNGRSFTVRSNEADEFDRGDRVRVVGTYDRSRGVVIASDIDRDR